MPQPPAVSVVIPTYNRAEMLGHTLRSLAGQTGDRNCFEVVVADDGSSDDTPAIVSRFRGALQIRHVHRPRDEAEIARMGGYCVSRIRNFGARHATAPLILFLDSGVVAGPGLVDAHRAAHAGDERIAVLGYTFGTNKVRPFRPLEEMLRSCPPDEIVAAIGDGPRGLDLRHADLARMEFDLGRMAAPWIFFWTLNLSLRAADFWSAGGFDERFRGWGYEDVELGYRLIRDGTALTASRASWAIEWPNWPDISATHESSERNRFYFRGKFQDPDLELYFNIYTRRSFLKAYEEAHAELRAWSAEVRGRDVDDELAGITLPDSGGVLVLGCGGRIPAHWPAVTLADFDADALSRATASGGHTGLHCIGLDTGLPDGTVRHIVVTSRLRGLWSRWETVIREEADRLGGRVVLTSPVVHIG